MTIPPESICILVSKSGWVSLAFDMEEFIRNGAIFNDVTVDGREVFG